MRCIGRSKKEFKLEIFKLKTKLCWLSSPRLLKRIFPNVSWSEDSSFLRVGVGGEKGCVMEINHIYSGTWMSLRRLLE